MTPSPLFGRVLSHSHNTTHVGRDTSFCLATTVPSLSLPSLSLERNSFISEAPQLLPSNSSPCHIPALKNTFKFCTAIATTMLPAMHRANAIGMGLSRSHKQNSLSGTLQPVLLHSYGFCGLIQAAAIYSKHSASYLSLHRYSFSGILSPLPSQQVYHN